MAPDAYKLIEALGLPRPKRFALNQLAHVDPDRYIYVRGRHDIPMLNNRMTVRRVMHLIREGDIEEQSIRTIEESPDITYGGAAYVDPAGIYIELAVGHASGLLRRGLCAARFLYALSNHRSYISLVPQHIYVTQQDQTYATCSLTSIPNDQLSQIIPLICNQLMTASRSIPTMKPLLLEWIYSEAHGVQFVDCKQCAEAPLRVNFPLLFCDRPVTIEDTMADHLEGNMCLFGEFCMLYPSDIALRPFHARLQRQAILSHFLTHSRATPRILEIV